MQSIIQSDIPPKNDYIFTMVTPITYLYSIYKNVLYHIFVSQCKFSDRKKKQETKSVPS